MSSKREMARRPKRNQKKPPRIMGFLITSLSRELKKTVDLEKRKFLSVCSTIGQTVQLTCSHPKPLISLVPITCTTCCFQGQLHCYVTIPIVLPANHKPCLEQVQVVLGISSIVTRLVLILFRKNWYVTLTYQYRRQTKYEI